MFGKRAVLMAFSALFIGACGGTEAEQQPPEEFDTTQQPIIWECRSNEAWIRRWYNSSGTMTGYEDCCYGILTKHGTIGTARYTQQGLTACWSNPE